MLLLRKLQESFETWQAIPDIQDSLKDALLLALSAL